MSDLNQYRDSIDNIDQQLMKLFEKRMHLAKEVVEFKKKQGLAIYQPEREKQVIEKNIERLQDSTLKIYAKDLLITLMELSKDFQNEQLDTSSFKKLISTTKLTTKTKVGFQGVEGSFSQEAMIKYFNQDIQSYNYTTFEAVFKSLINQNIDYAILPIENSSTGAINDVLDLVNQYGVFIVGEIYLPIRQHLLGLKDSKINDLNEVFSHPQGLYQTSKFLKQYPDIKQTSYNNTAMAAKYIYELNDKTKGAIASLKAAELYDLEILQKDIQNTQSNHTRFIILSRELNNKSTNNKLSILFTLEHHSGTLSNILRIIARHGLNMVNIQSRPVIETPWEYYFYVDLMGNLEDQNVLKALSIIKKNCVSLRLLGGYKHEEK
jgi:monofunctional chorismate mutase, gram positive-type, clade 2